MSQEEKHGLLNKLKKPFRSHSRSSSINSEKAPGSAGTGTSSGSKRGSSGASGATNGRSIEELAYQEGRKRAEIERKGGSSSGTGSGAALGAGAGAGAGAAVSSHQVKVIYQGSRTTMPTRYCHLRKDGWLDIRLKSTDNLWIRTWGATSPTKNSQLTIVW